jgi:hypothetical protein
MALHVKYGPDGGVFVSDWYDTGECHTRKPHTENGRIYKITYGDVKPAIRFDVAKMSNEELIRLQSHKNEWWVRHARRVLAERWGVVAKLAAHGEDVGDQNLPLMDWYALEPMVAAEPKRGLALAMRAKIPTLREFAARRVAEKSGTTKDTKVTKN